VHAVSQALLWHDRQSDELVERPAPVEPPAQTDLEDPLGSYLKEIGRGRLLFFLMILRPPRSTPISAAFTERSSIAG